MDSYVLPKLRLITLGGVLNSARAELSIQMQVFSDAVPAMRRPLLIIRHGYSPHATPGWRQSGAFEPELRQSPLPPDKEHCGARHICRPLKKFAQDQAIGRKQRHVSKPYGRSPDTRSTPRQRVNAIWP